MFYGVYKLYGEQYSGFYNDHCDEWFKDTFCPDTKVQVMVDLTTHGKTYAERKASLEDVALQFEDLFTVYGVDMSYYELSVWQTFFERYGKRYGLLRDFHENGIC